MSNVVFPDDDDQYYLVEYVSMTDPMQVVSMTLPKGCFPPHILQCTDSVAEAVLYYRTAAIWDEVDGLPVCSRPREEEESSSLSMEGLVESDAALAVRVSPLLEERLNLLAEEWRRNKQPAQRGSGAQ